MIRWLHEGIAIVEYVVKEALEIRPSFTDLSQALRNQIELRACTSELPKTVS